MTMPRPHALRSSVAACAIAFLLVTSGQARPGDDHAGCALHARVADPDTAGTNVRAGPSPRAPIVAHLPHERALAADSVVPELDIVDFRDGWAQVRRIRFADYGEGETILFAGTGWISGRLLSASLASMPADRPAHGGVSALWTARSSKR